MRPLEGMKDGKQRPGRCERSLTATVERGLRVVRSHPHGEWLVAGSPQWSPG